MAFRVVGIGLLGILLALAAQVGLLYKESLSALQASQDAPADYSCPKFDPDAAISRFRHLITFPSVSDVADPLHTGDKQALEALLAAMEEQYADVWAQLEVEKVGANGYSRLVTWRGSDPSLEPVLFVSHYDVVPVTPGTEGDWRYPPFSGALEEGYVWGRGTADVKIGVAGLLEAVMGLLRGGWTPARTVMLGLGHDEEVGGRLGAAKTAALLASRGVTLDIVVDEGGLVFEDGLKPFLPGRPVAMVATAEKGYTMIQVTLRSAGGHSSIPPIDGSSVMRCI
ncbi:hypothetical protein HYH03_001626 [Edaphochlamys debaryana]|uniref:Uncharacterized protein n=1 Tax=Edaphochlamys debaryana TaxID=47281 RepID=A0A835YDG3_9CHLO|nr:hypothetical protein HYH03_001626 [Edaphochlamys debaryana]|eukprot:KAG2500865.1 hypothetical protein HYH03_001626 [Edaphochlamys debaryana]